MGTGISVIVNYLEQYKHLNGEKCGITNCDESGMFYLPEEKIVLCYQHFIEFKKKLVENR